MTNYDPLCPNDLLDVTQKGKLRNFAQITTWGMVANIGILAVIQNAIHRSIKAIFLMDLIS